jgi:hypothetical protein
MKMISMIDVAEAASEPIAQIRDSSFLAERSSAHQHPTVSVRQCFEVLSLGRFDIPLLLSHHQKTQAACEIHILYRSFLAECGSPRLQ